MIAHQKSSISIFSRIATAFMVLGLMLMIGASPAPAAFPGGNGKIAFSSTVGGDSEIYTVKPDGSGLFQVTNNEWDEAQVAWSPDGSRIAYLSNRHGNYEIYTANPIGHDTKRLTYHAAGDRGPAWSADGKSILFSSDRDGDSEIYRMSAADGSRVTKLTSNTAWDSGPAVSTKGAVAFTSDRDGDFDIYTMNLDGTSVQNHTNGGISKETSPNWSPDGTRLTFERIAFMGEMENVWTMNADGSGATRLTTGENLQPAWSPSGTKITWARHASATEAEIGVMHANGTGPVTITHSSPGRASSPDWQPVPMRALP